jgi:hypothetical protein
MKEEGKNRNYISRKKKQRCIQASGICRILEGILNKG